ncbi:nucleoside-diphosphate-sugar epimerase [Cryobacterium sp. CAN_C3]|uniref:NAD-dependent epimerase/dehydratase family protein n=1 Tax=unclassified Cryobacterium TaxID=2649013 RepID=UPI0018CB0FD5|nr:NAD-dependent epimerase/dehydratase family protein [Cryobacterium sp. CAN_C3]MEC5155682.1 nucleoside-diphosphate-sugar epimerase [Cryobacterium sp. CAN_C3]
MRKSAFVLGASGQVGRAVINSLLSAGWHVRAGSRTTYEFPVDVEGVLVDREVDSSVVEALAGGADVLIDCVAYSETHARQVLALEGLIGSAVVLSSVSVYADSSGRTLDEAQRIDDFPQFPVPVLESQTRTQPGDQTYSTRKVAMEDVLVSADAALPVTVLRPGAISGPGSVHPRELWFVKRALDHRPVQLLNWGGQSQFHTSSTVNIAELVRLAANQPARRVLNAVDPKASTTTEIGSRINEILDHHPVKFVVPGSPGVGDTPWSVPKPFVMDMSEAVRDLGYKPAMGYAEALQNTVGWIVSALGGRAWQDAFPTFLHANGPEAFDYVAEDAWVQQNERRNGRS